jgi:hypothetical protein
MAKSKSSIKAQAREAKRKALLEWDQELERVERKLMEALKKIDQR